MRVTTGRVLLLHAIDPPNLAGGRYAAPAWVILALGGAAVVFCAVFLFLRLRSKGPR